MLSSSGPRGRLGAIALWWVLVPLSIMLLAWQPVPLVPASGVDPSWGAGLEMALHNGLTFGSQVVFTYGPLGFLSVSQLWFNHLGELSFAYTVLLRFGLAAAVFAGARRDFGGPAAFGIAAVVASVDDLLIEMVLALIITVWAIAKPLLGRPALLLSAAMGGFAGMQLLNKQSTGISVTVTAAILVLGLPGSWKKHAGAATLSLVGTVLVFWAVTGQALNALPQYAQNMTRLVSGYAAAMSLEQPGLGWQLTAAFVGLGLGLWGAWQMTATSAPRQRWAVVLLWLAFWFFVLKEGFVRHDEPHAVFFFDALLGGFLAFRWRPGKRLAALLGIAALLGFALAAQAQSLTGDLDPSRNVTAALDELKVVAGSSRRSQVMADGRALIEATEPIDPASQSLLDGHTVAVYPWEIALVWAYHLDWRPTPVLQSYAAFTPQLDQLDAGFLESTRAPQRMLLHATPGLDGRVLWFDQPQTSRTILCRYLPLRSTPTIAVLGRVPNRCAGDSLLETVHADWYQTVPVPAPPVPHSLVFVRIDGAGPGVAERIAGIFWRPSLRFVTLNGLPPQRFVTGTAGDGLPLRASAGVDFPAPFHTAFGAKTIAVISSGQSPTGGHPLTYRFYWESVNPR